MPIGTGSPQMVEYLCAALIISSVQAGQKKPVDMFRSCGKKIEVYGYEGYTLNIRGAILSDLENECEVKFYGRRGISLFYIVKRVENNAEQVVVYIKTSLDSSSYTTQESIDHRWSEKMGKSKLNKRLSGGDSTIINVKRRWGRSRDFSITVEILGAEYKETKNKDVDSTGTTKADITGIMIGLIAFVGLCIRVLVSAYRFCAKTSRPTCCEQNRRQSALEPSPTATTSGNVSSVTERSHQDGPTASPNSCEGHMEQDSSHPDETSDLLRNTTSVLDDRPADHSELRDSRSDLLAERMASINRYDDASPSYLALVPYTPRIIPSGDCLPTYEEALQL